MAVKGMLQIGEILEEYGESIQDGITKIAEQVADDDAKKLRNTRNTYKIRTGDYNRGWTVKDEYKVNKVKCIVHNATDYQLTHLLERGHDWVGRDGTRKKNTSKAYVHIAPVEKESNQTYLRKVEELIKNGG